MSSSDENESIVEESEDSERTAIQSELSSLSFEELQKLKERIGAKVYNEALFGNKKKNNATPKVFKRENKNRPREESSKKPVPMVSGQVARLKKQEVRDPRFDPLCGEFDKKQFSENYGFLSNLRMQDIKAARKELKQTTDPEKQLKLRRLLQRLNDQHKATKKGKLEREKIQRDREDVEKQFREGKQPHFKKKSELRVEALVKQYENLKKEGNSRVQRHLKRREQKIKKRSNRAPTGVS